MKKNESPTGCKYENLDSYGRFVFYSEVKNRYLPELTISASASPTRYGRYGEAYVLYEKAEPP